MWMRRTAAVALACLPAAASLAADSPSSAREDAGDLRIVHPTANDHVAGLVPFLIEQRRPGVLLSSVRSGSLEASADGRSWTPVLSVEDVPRSWWDASETGWRLRWTPELALRGRQQVRVVLRTRDGTLVSPPVELEFEEPQNEEPGEPEREQRQDPRGGRERAPAACKCQSIEVRGDDLPAEAVALGPTADRQSAWRVRKGDDDGATLGPLKDNPKNGAGRWLGYSFEIACDVEGRPGACDEIQLVKASGEYRGVKGKECAEGGGVWDATHSVCRFTHTWKGNAAALSKAGKADISAPGQAACTALGGRWEGGKCVLSFPYDGPRFGPDVKGDGPEFRDGAYERPDGLKRHVGTKIVWKDMIGVGGAGNDSFLRARVLAVVKGTDNLFCYVLFDVEVRKDATGQRTETLRIVRQGNRVGAGQIP